MVRALPSLLGSNAESSPDADPTSLAGAMSGVEPWHGSWHGFSEATAVPRKKWWRRRESNPANSMIWALYHHGISHKFAIHRGRWVACVRYHAWRTAIQRLAWTNGTMAVPRRGVSRALWYLPTPADGDVNGPVRLSSTA
jgi:hypothetical protein